MADKNTIARPYARAAFDVAREADALDAWSASLASAAAVMADGTVAEFLSTPRLTDAERLGFLAELLASASEGRSVLAGDDRRGTNFLKLLVEYDRVAVLPEISEHFDGLKAAVENTVDVTVTSASPLTDELTRAITDALKARLGREVRLETKIDETLIGGAVIRAGDVVIDGSLRSRLESLSNALVA